MVRQVPNPQELNDKIRQLLASHITQGVAQATEEAKKAVQRQLASQALKSDLSQLVQRTVEELLPSLSERIKAKTQEQLLASLRRQITELGEEVRKDVTEQALDAMKINAPRMGEAAFPRVVELMKDWLDAEGDLGGKLAAAPTPAVAEDVAANAELLAGIDERLRSLEAQRKQDASEDTFLQSLEDRLAELEGAQAGISSGAADAALTSIEARLAALEGDDLPRPSSAVAAALATDPVEDGDLGEIESRVSTLESNRSEFADQVAEEVASMGDRVYAIEKDIHATRDAFRAISERLERLVARTEELAARPVAPPSKPHEVPSTIDLKDLSERVAILAVGPLMQAIDGRLEELDLEGLPDRVAETVVPKATQRILQRLRVADEPPAKQPDVEEDALGEDPAGAESASDIGFVDDQFAKFRRERLEEQGRRRKPISDAGYLTESDAGKLEVAPASPLVEPDEELDDYAKRERDFAQWARGDGAEPEPEEAPAEVEPPPPLPQRMPPRPGEDF